MSFSWASHHTTSVCRTSPSHILGLLTISYAQTDMSSELPMPPYYQPGAHAEEMRGSLILRVPIITPGPGNHGAEASENTVAIAFHDSFRRDPGDVGLALRRRANGGLGFRRDIRVLDGDDASESVLRMPKVYLDPQDFGYEEDDDVEPAMQLAEEAALAHARKEEEVRERERKEGATKWDWIVGSVMVFLLALLLLEDPGRPANSSARSSRDRGSTWPRRDQPDQPDQHSLHVVGDGGHHDGLDMGLWVLGAVDSMLHVLETQVLQPDSLMLDVYGTSAFNCSKNEDGSLTNDTLLEVFSSAVLNSCQFLDNTLLHSPLVLSPDWLARVNTTCTLADTAMLDSFVYYRLLQRSLTGDLRPNHGVPSPAPRVAQDIWLVLVAMRDDVRSLDHRRDLHRLSRSEANHHFRAMTDWHLNVSIARVTGLSYADSLGYRVREKLDTHGMFVNQLARLVRWLTIIEVGTENTLRVVDGALYPWTVAWTEALRSLWDGGGFIEMHGMLGNRMTAELERCMPWARAVGEEAKRMKEALMGPLQTAEDLLARLSEVEKAGWRVRRGGGDADEDVTLGWEGLATGLDMLAQRWRATVSRAMEEGMRREFGETSEVAVRS
jgi:hypothetical protein